MKNVAFPLSPAARSSARTCLVEVFVGPAKQKIRQFFINSIQKQTVPSSKVNATLFPEPQLLKAPIGSGLGVGAGVGAGAGAGMGAGAGADMGVGGDVLGSPSTTFCMGEREGFAVVSSPIKADGSCSSGCGFVASGVLLLSLADLTNVSAVTTAIVPTTDMDKVAQRNLFRRRNEGGLDPVESDSIIALSSQENGFGK